MRLVNTIVDQVDIFTNVYCLLAILESVQQTIIDYGGIKLMLLKQPGDMPSSCVFSESMLRSRSGMRLAMRANHWYNMPPFVPRREQDSSSHWWKNENSAGRQAEPGYHIEALVPLEAAEDNAWLNDVAPPRPKSSLALSTSPSAGAREQQEIRPSNDVTGKTTPSTANEYSLLCWL
jgi:hypothetical protein